MPRASLRLKHSGIRRTNIYGYGCQLRFRSAKSLAEDVAFTKAAIDGLKSEVVLAGHSYCGVVITEAGTHPKVTDLVYIAAFAPDKGESVSSLIANPPPGAPVPPILPPRDGYLFLDREKFAASFAADIERGTASFMADSRVPWGVDALAGAVSKSAWKTKPSYYLVALMTKCSASGPKKNGRARESKGDGSGRHSFCLCFEATRGRRNHRRCFSEVTDLGHCFARF